MEGLNQRTSVLKARTSELNRLAQLDIPYLKEEDRLKVLLHGNRSEIIHAIVCSIETAKKAADEIGKRLEKGLSIGRKEQGECNKLLETHQRLQYFYGEWQHSYREAYLHDEDCMEELDVEEFYAVLHAARKKSLQ